MKNRPIQIISLLLVLLFSLPAPTLVALAQEANAQPAQDKPQEESEEAKKLRKKEESRNKKDEERQRKEAKAREVQDKKYRTLSEFAADLYVSDVDFRNQVDDGYLDLQSRHADQAYEINISRAKDLSTTAHDGAMLKRRRGLYDNPRVQEYVNRLGQQIVPEDSDKLYTFKVVVGPVPYAYTLSTGTILISTGMISLLDNEAQLAYVLAHELAHVHKDHWRMKIMMPLAEAEYNRKQELKRIFWTSLLALSATGVGAAVAGEKGAGIGLVSGLVAGQVVSDYYARHMALDWNAAQENEADDFAMKATLGKSFDIQEVPRLYNVMAQVAGSDYRTQLGFLGARSRIKERTEHAQKLISGALQHQYQEALKANKIKGMGPEFNTIMAELKRDNGIEAFYHDMFQLARVNLQQSVMARSDDALAAYYYGRVLKQVGRTKEELDLAQQSLLRAISLDVRRDIPEAQLHRALMLMDSKDSANQAEAIAALKSYMTAYGQKRATNISNEDIVPENADVLYGYMRLLGEKTWTAPTVSDILKVSSTHLTSGAPATQPAPATIPTVRPPAEMLSPTNKRKVRKP